AQERGEQDLCEWDDDADEQSERNAARNRAARETPQLRSQHAARKRADEAVMLHLLARGHVLAKPVGQPGLGAEVDHDSAPALRGRRRACKPPFAEPMDAPDPKAVSRARASAAPCRAASRGP